LITAKEHRQDSINHMEGISDRRLPKDFWTLSIVRNSITRKHKVSETGSVSETLCFLVIEFRTMDKVQKPNIDECYTPSSEPYRVYYRRRFYVNQKTVEIQEDFGKCGTNLWKLNTFDCQYIKRRGRRKKNVLTTTKMEIAWDFDITSENYTQLCKMFQTTVVCSVGTLCKLSCAIFVNMIWVLCKVWLWENFKAELAIHTTGQKKQILYLSILLQ
jgi:hypothetical protein